MKALAAIRVQKIKSLSTIRAAETHGRRLDEASKRRVDKSRSSLNLASSQYSPDTPLALEGAYKAFKKATGAAEGKGSAIMAHMIAVISPEILAEAGDPRDPNNPKVRALFDQAQAWAQAEFGEESLIAARLDVDEAGAGVVDLFVCPTAMQAGGRGRKPRLTISIKSGLEAVAAKNGNKRSYSAIQDSWGDWASHHIDHRLQRGKPKRETMRQHVHADLFRERVEELNQRQDELDQRERELERCEKKAEIRAKKAINVGFTACVRDEISIIRPDSKSPWEIRYSPELPDDRRQYLIETFDGFTGVIVRVIRTIMNMLKQQNVAVKDYAAILKQDDDDAYDLGWSDGPTL